MRRNFGEDFSAGARLAWQALKDRIRYGTGISETSRGMRRLVSQVKQVL